MPFVRSIARRVAVVLGIGKTTLLKCIMGPQAAQSAGVMFARRLASEFCLLDDSRRVAAGAIGGELSSRLR